MSWGAIGASVAGAVVSSELSDGGSPAKTTSHAPSWWATPAKIALGDAKEASEGLEFVWQTPEQREALNMMEDVARNLDTGTADQAGGLARRTLRGDFLDPSTNPELRATIDAATGQVIDRFQRDVRPAIGSQAQQAGAWGGARHGLAEARAADEVTENIGEISSRMLSNAYQSERGLQAQMAQMAPSIFQLENRADLLPAQVLGDVGNTRRQFESERERFPFERSQELLGTIASVNPRGGTQVHTRAQPGAGVEAMRGAMGGAQLWNTFNQPSQQQQTTKWPSGSSAWGTGSTPLSAGGN